MTHVNIFPKCLFTLLLDFSDVTGVWGLNQGQGCWNKNTHFEVTFKIYAATRLTTSCSRPTGLLPFPSACTVKQLTSCMNLLVCYSYAMSFLSFINAASFFFYNK